ncbi:Mitochondrial tRNAs modification protein [Kalmusia sp. IMI 367209]|nr:Mitochondrial tRNAs modification protein [Kalmusia sp. IMI 367209]
MTLAIETSCDDTSVAVLESQPNARLGKTAARLHFHKKVTANNAAFNGVHPLAALESHQENLASLVSEAINHLPEKRSPDFISVTRGPGMRSNLFTGLDTAKGLAVAWQIPLVGVHHMQAHALTPRLVAALETSGHLPQLWQNTHTGGATIRAEPEFPFLSVLASGGHTLIIHSATLTGHKVLGSTSDVAVGECLDKIARAVLPVDELQKAGDTMYGALLENFAFSKNNVPRPREALSSELRRQTQSTVLFEKNSARGYRMKYESHYTYQVPKNNEDALQRNMSRWGWAFNQPLAKASGGLKNKSLEMSFSGLMTAVERAVRYQRDQPSGKLTKIERSPKDISLEERRDMAQFSMRAAFEHVAARVVLALQHTPVSTVVMAGGVAANSYLRYILASTLCAHGYDDMQVVFPPPKLCSDNAAMIAWAGTEMYQAGITNPLTIRAVRKWPLDQLLSPPLEKTT